jgi:hypothetical protein
MVLGEVLRDEKGNVLLAQGVVLSEAMLASLARHGVELLPILTTAHTEEAVDPAQAQERLDRVFRRHERGNHADWATGILRQYIEDFRMKREVQR